MKSIKSRAYGISLLAAIAIPLLAGCTKDSGFKITYHYLNNETKTIKVKKDKEFTLEAPKEYESKSFYRFFEDETYKNSAKSQYVADKDYDFYALYNQKDHYFVTYYDYLADGDFNFYREEVSSEEEYTFKSSPLIKEGNYIISYIDKNAEKTVYYPYSKITLTSHLELNSVWHKEYNGEFDGQPYSVRIYNNIVGLGAAVMIIDGKEKYGFYNSSAKEFEFYFGEDDEWPFDEDIAGFINGEDSFIGCNNAEKGMFVLMDNVKMKTDQSTILYLDGYGSAVVAQYDGQGLDTKYYGSYSKNPEGDYLLTDINPETSLPTGKSLTFRMDQVNRDFSGETINGYFEVKGLEQDNYSLYEDLKVNSEYQLNIDGYGDAILTKDKEVIKGRYASVAYKEYDALDRTTKTKGEFEFTSNDAKTKFKFKIDDIEDSDAKQRQIFVKYNEKLDGIFSKEGDNSSSSPTIGLDGFNMINLFKTTGKVDCGTYYFNSKNNQIICKMINENDTKYTLIVKLNLTNKTYEYVTDGLIIENNTIVTGFTGTSSIIEIPEGITEIDDDVFNYLYLETTITEVHLPSTIKKIGERAFENNGTLKTVYFEGSVPPSIDKTTFRWPGGEFKIVVPNGSEDVYRNADVFKDTYAKYIYSVDEFSKRPEFEISGKTLLSFNPIVGKDYSKITIPSEVEIISDLVFKGITYIKEVDFNNVTRIGEQTFENCSNIEKINAPKVEYIGIAAFIDCGSLNNVKLPAIKEICATAFSGCYSLNNVECGVNLESIGNQAFSQCAIKVINNGDEEILANELFYLTLLGTKAPRMASKIFYGTSPKIILNSMEIALDFYYNGTNWVSYFNHIFVESGEEKGDYIDISNLLGVKVDGRMELYEFEVYFYIIKGNVVTIYYMDDGILYSFNATYSASEGFIFDETQFVRKGTKLTYKCGSETLEVDTNYTRQDYAYVYNAKYNGQDVTIIALNNSATMTIGYTKYTLNLSGDGTFTYTTSVATHTETYTNSDGSVLNITFSNTIIKVQGTLKSIIRNDGNPLTTSVGWYATDLGNNKYSFTVQWQQTDYDVVITLNSDGTFTYTYDVGSRISCRSQNNDVITVVVNAQNEVTKIILAFRDDNGGLINASLTWTKENDYYLLNVNFEEDYIDPKTGALERRPSPRNGQYKLTLDLTNKSAVLTKLS